MGPPIWKNPLILTTNILGLGIKVAHCVYYCSSVLETADAQVVGEERPNDHEEELCLCCFTVASGQICHR